jgi:DnaK suppressor protein
VDPYQAIRARLEKRRDEITRMLGRIEGDLRKPGDRDWQERATEAENDEVLERLGENALQELERIREALGRLEQGSYGVCASCGDPIAPRRLEVLPFTTVCVACAD